VHLDLSLEEREALATALREILLNAIEHGGGLDPRARHRGRRIHRSRGEVPARHHGKRRDVRSSSGMDLAPTMIRPSM
jgi:hypothetical protein